VEEIEWYNLTGNGFPPPLYSVFKIMWYRDHEPEMFDKIDKIIGTKDFINYKLTGQIVTDYSYASGSGIYDLRGWKYSEALIKAAALPIRIFPEIVPSTAIIGEITQEAAEALGLPQHIKVVAGGVDISCMTLGARGIEDGRIHNSIGSSSWIAVASNEPLLEIKTRPYVFAHVMPEMFMSAVAIFSAGSSFRWVRDQLCQSIVNQAEVEGIDAYELMTMEAALSQVGSNNLLFNPSLAGGSSMDQSANIRGAFLGIDLGHTRSDLIRAAMEGIALGLRLALNELKRLTNVQNEMMVVGGGSRSHLWRQIFADVYNMRIVKTNIDQQTAALGAAALAAVGSNIWSDFKIIDEIHQGDKIAEPIPENNAHYEKLLSIYEAAGRFQSEIGDMLAGLKKS
jgi:xylulokinase